MKISFLPLMIAALSFQNCRSPQPQSQTKDIVLSPEDVRSDNAMNPFPGLTVANLNASPLSARHAHTAAAVDGKFVVWGGYDGSLKNDGAVFDLRAMKWLQ
jgi:hypothetical protein